MNKITLGIKILLARKDIGMKQIELAKRLKTPPSVVNHWEKDIFKPNATSTQKISKILGKPISYFHDEGKTFMISEPSAAYSPEENPVWLPILSELPEDMGNFNDKNILGFTAFPRFLFPGAKFIVRGPANISINNKKLSENDYCIICPQSASSGKGLALIQSGKIFSASNNPPIKRQKPIGYIAGIIHNLE